MTKEQKNERKNEAHPARPAKKKAHPPVAHAQEKKAAEPAAYSASAAPTVAVGNSGDPKQNFLGAVKAAQEEPQEDKDPFDDILKIFGGDR